MQFPGRIGAILAGCPDPEESAGRYRGIRQRPLEGLGGIIGQKPTESADRFGAGVEQLDPVALVPVFVAQPGAVT